MGGAQGLEEDEAQIGNKTLARFKLGRTPDQKKKKKLGRTGCFPLLIKINTFSIELTGWGHHTRATQVGSC